MRPQGSGVIQYVLEDSGQTLVLARPVIAHLDRYRQRRDTSREAGGQLFARFMDRTVRVERATGPRSTDRRSRWSFLPDRLAERREVKRLFRIGLNYVGDWHTHPERVPRPSGTDVDSVTEMFRKSRHRLAGFVIVIRGTACLPEGLFVGICNESGCRALRLHENQ